MGPPGALRDELVSVCSAEVEEVSSAIADNRPTASLESQGHLLGCVRRQPRDGVAGWVGRNGGEGRGDADPHPRARRG